MSALSEAWTLLKDTILSFIDDEALSRGAAIAFYTVTSIAPVLLIVIAIAGLAFGRDAAQNAIIAQLSGLMGPQTGEVLQSAVASAAGKSSGIVATIVGIITLIATASGVFGEMQSALNAIWKAKPKGTTVSRLIRARATQSGVGRGTGVPPHGFPCGVRHKPSDRYPEPRPSPARFGGKPGTGTAMLVVPKLGADARDHRAARVAAHDKRSRVGFLTI
jgi:hypothetical protein